MKVKKILALLIVVAMMVALVPATVFAATGLTLTLPDGVKAQINEAVVEEGEAGAGGVVYATEAQLQDLKTDDKVMLYYTDTADTKLINYTATGLTSGTVEKDVSFTMGTSNVSIVANLATVYTLTYNSADFTVSESEDEALADGKYWSNEEIIITAVAPAEDSYEKITGYTADEAVTETVAFAGGVAKFKLNADTEITAIKETNATVRTNVGPNAPTVEAALITKVNKVPVQNGANKVENLAQGTVVELTATGNNFLYWAMGDTTTPYTFERVFEYTIAEGDELVDFGAFYGKETTTEAYIVMSGGTAYGSLEDAKTGNLGDAIDTVDVSSGDPVEIFIKADDPANAIFDKWTQSIGTLTATVEADITKLTIPAGTHVGEVITVIAKFIPVYSVDASANATAKVGDKVLSNTDKIQAGTEVTVEYTGSQILTGWTVPDSITNPGKVTSFKFKMPAENVTIAAVDAPAVTVTVVGATLSGVGDPSETSETNDSDGRISRKYENVPANTPVMIAADGSTNGTNTVVAWDMPEGVSKLVATSGYIKFTVSDPKVDTDYVDESTITATYSEPGDTHVKLTVVDGTGTGVYPANSEVEIYEVVPEGREFDKWVLSEGSGATLIEATADAPAKVKLAGNDATVTATFVDKGTPGGTPGGTPEEETYKVTYSGVGEDATGGDAFYKAGDEVTVYAGTIGEATFLGWTTSVALGLTEEQMDQATITFIMPAIDVELTGNWDGIDLTEYKITFHAGNATTAMLPAEYTDGTYTQTMYKGIDTKLIENMFTAEGYTFLGWTLADGKVTSDGIITDQAVVSILGDMNFYGYWMSNEDITEKLTIKYSDSEFMHGIISDLRIVIEELGIENFIKVVLGDVDITSNVTIESGSLIITIPSEILEQLVPNRNYELRIDTTEGHILQTISVLDAESPETGDNTDVGMWIALAIAALVCGVGSAYLVISKKKVNK